MKEIKLSLENDEYLLRLDEDLPNRVLNYSVARHCNAEYELFVILSGNCIMDVEDQSYPLEAGDALLIAPNQFHCSLMTSADLVNFILPFAVPLGAHFKNLHERIAPCVRLQLSPTSLEHCRGVILETQTKGPFWRERVEANCALLMSELFRMLPTGTQQRSHPSVADSDRRIAVIDDFFESYATQYGTEELLASKLHISRRQLSRVLMTHYGMSFRQKMLRARMDRAAWLLRTTDLSVGQISEEIGYFSETSFFKAFRGHYRTTPLAYRKSFEKKQASQ